MIFIVSSVCQGKTTFIKNNPNYGKFTLHDADDLSPTDKKRVGMKQPIPWRHDYWVKHSKPNQVLLLSSMAIKEYDPDSIYLFVKIPLHQLMKNIKQRQSDHPEYTYGKTRVVLGSYTHLIKTIVRKDVGYFTGFEEAMKHLESRVQ